MANDLPLPGGYWDFRLGIQVIDWADASGAIQWTPWASEGKQGWSNFAVDKDHYDPDAIAVHMDVRPNKWVNHDFAIGLIAKDFNEPGQGAARLTPPISHLMKGFNPKQPHPVWAETAPASDMDEYDPDTFSIGLITYPNATPIVSTLDFHVEARVADRIGPKLVSWDWGLWRATPPVSKGGGWTGFAYDSDKHDPDYAQLKLVLGRVN